MNDLLDDFVASAGRDQRSAPEQEFVPQQPARQQAAYGHRRGASAPVQSPFSGSGGSFIDKDSAYGGLAVPERQPSYQGSLAGSEKAERAPSIWARAKAKARGKSKDWNEENRPVNAAGPHCLPSEKPKGTRHASYGRQDSRQPEGRQPNGKQAPDARESVQQLKEGMDGFFKDVGLVKALLGQIQEQTQAVEAAHEHGKMCTTSEQQRASRERVQELVQDVTSSVKKCKDKLTTLEDLNEDAIEQAEAAGVQDMTEIQMRLGIMTGLHVKLQDQCAAFGAMRARWAEEDKAEVGRQLYTVTGQHFEDEELQAVVDSGESHSIYQRALMAPGQSHQLTLEMVSQIEQRHSEMAELERSLLDLHQIFLDMSVLVAGQAEMLDRIEGWVVNTQEQMRAALKDLQKAKVSRRAAQQKRAVTFTTGVGLIGVGAGLSATGAGAVVGVPIALAGVAVAGVGAVM